MTYPNCPQCQYSLTYHDGTQLVCPECAHEWPEGDADNSNGEQAAVLKVKGSSMVIKQGTKVKNIRLQEGDHDIGCKIDGTPMNLKSEFVKKA